VAKTVEGQLKFFNKGQRVGQRDIPPKAGTPNQAQVAGQIQPQASQKVPSIQNGKRAVEELPSEDSPSQNNGATSSEKL
jgi:hypothetical protein